MLHSLFVLLLRSREFKMINEMSLEAYEANCFLCGSAKVKRARDRRPVDFHKIRYFYKCQSCKGYSLWPKLEDWEIQKLYSANYIGDVNLDSPPDHEVNMARFDKLKKFLTGTENRIEKRFLDYGCGASAEVVILAKNLGFQSFGVEVATETRVQASQESGCKIYSPEEIAEGRHEFDIVFLGDLLEHVSNPISILSVAKKSLRQGGVLVIQGPLEGATTLSNSLVAIKARLLAGRPSSFPPYHVSLATQLSIAKMLNAASLQLILKEITEPLWPAAALGSRESVISLSRFLLSFAKLLDLAIHKVNKSYGTRFFSIAEK